MTDKIDKAIKICYKMINYYEKKQIYKIPKAYKQFFYMMAAALDFTIKGRKTLFESDLHDFRLGNTDKMALIEGEKRISRKRLLEFIETWLYDCLYVSDRCSVSRLFRVHYVYCYLFSLHDDFLPGIIKEKYPNLLK